MTDHPGFLARILEYPEDDAARLVYADWLQENGQGERAEFIRVQWDIARICEGNRQHRPERDADRLPALISRESELWSGVWKYGWADPVPHAWLSDSVVRRGFVESVTCTAADWLVHSDLVLARQPVMKVKFPGIRLSKEYAPMLERRGSVGDFLLRSTALARYVVDVTSRLNRPGTNIRNMDWEGNPTEAVS